MNSFQALEQAKRMQTQSQHRLAATLARVIADAVHRASDRLLRFLAHGETCRFPRA